MTIDDAGRPHRRAVRRRAAGRRARVLAPARRGPRHRAGPAGPDDPRRGDPRLGARARPGRHGLRGDRVRDPGDPPDQRPAGRRTTRSPSSWPTIPEVLEAHTITGAGDMLVRDRGPLERRPAAGHRPAARGRRRGARVDRDRARHPDQPPRPAPRPGAPSTDGRPARRGDRWVLRRAKSASTHLTSEALDTEDRPMRLRRHTAARGLSAVAVACAAAAPPSSARPPVPAPPRSPCRPPTRRSPTGSRPGRWRRALGQDLAGLVTDAATGQVIWAQTPRRARRSRRPTPRSSRRSTPWRRSARRTRFTTR